MLELLVVIIIMTVITGTGAISLTSKTASIKLKGQASLVLKTLRTARERALAEGKTWKVRFHQTRACSTVDDLFWRDGIARPGISPVDDYGNHQFVFSAPVEAWYLQGGTSPYDVSPTTVFPSVLKDMPNYDGGLPANRNWMPLMNLKDLSTSPPGDLLPTSLASIRLSGIQEIDPDVRIVRINGPTHPTFTQGSPPRYAQQNFTEPLPTNPTTLDSNTRRPLVRTANPPSYLFFDDRIADVTYSPDGVFKFQPCPDTPIGNPTTFPDMTITFATYAGATGVAAASEQLTITIDRTTGYPHF
ncbi:MAG: type II secretion system protein [Candidatus Riflebacteria bacterium]|nr:type II secretion system protein [Candidatus Riflebacteria bacterium]